MPWCHNGPHACRAASLLHAAPLPSPTHCRPFLPSPMSHPRQQHTNTHSHTHTALQAPSCWAPPPPLLTPRAHPGCCAPSFSNIGGGAPHPPPHLLPLWLCWNPPCVVVHYQEQGIPRCFSYSAVVVWLSGAEAMQLGLGVATLALVACSHTHTSAPQRYVLANTAPTWVSTLFCIGLNAGTWTCWPSTPSCRRGLSTMSESLQPQSHGIMQPHTGGQRVTQASHAVCGPCQPSTPSPV